MLVSEFMIPKEQVVTCIESDPISKVINDVMENHISCVVVIKDDMPVGIITKTDLVRAYQNNIDITDQIDTIMTRDLQCVLEQTNRDDAAKVFERQHTHHAIVVDKGGLFRGVISAWDIAAECAKDSRAWPYHRNLFGRFAVSH